MYSLLHLLIFTAIIRSLTLNKIATLVAQNLYFQQSSDRSWSGLVMWSCRRLSFKAPSYTFIHTERQGCEPWSLTWDERQFEDIATNTHTLSLYSLWRVNDRQAALHFWSLSAVSIPLLASFPAGSSLQDPMPWTKYTHHFSLVVCGLEVFTICLTSFYIFSMWSSEWGGGCTLLKVPSIVNTNLGSCDGHIVGFSQTLCYFIAPSFCQMLGNHFFSTHCSLTLAFHEQTKKYIKIWKQTKESLPRPHTKPPKKINK